MAAATTGHKSIPDESNNQAVFGNSLSALPDSALVPDIFVPKIVYDCVEFLRRNALRCKGLFRMAGFVQKRNIIREKLNRGIAVAFGGEDIGASESISDCNTVADLLKRYLRELPEPPVPGPVFASYKRIVAADGAGITTSISLLARLADTALPPLNYNLLKYVCLFLNNVALFHDENDMDAYNLAVIFTPNFLRLQEAPCPSELAKAATDWARDEVHFVRCLIENADFIFCNPYQPPTRAHVKVVTMPSNPPPINMSTPISSDWDDVFAPLKKIYVSERPAYRPVKYLSFIQQYQQAPEKITSPLKLAPTSSSVSPKTFPSKEEGQKQQQLGTRRMSQSLAVLSNSVSDSVQSPSNNNNNNNNNSIATASNAGLPVGRGDARTMVSTVSSRINMAESGLSKLEHDFTILTTRIGHV